MGLSHAIQPFCSAGNAVAHSDWTFAHSCHACLSSTVHCLVQDAYNVADMHTMQWQL